MILTKIDGDARGGAALSVKEVVGKPILFAGTGEKLDEFEPFHPDRMASRILGMGDVLTLIEKAEADLRRRTRRSKAEQKLRKGQLTLEDFLDQMQQVKKMGPLQNVLGMLPGHAQGDARTRRSTTGEIDRIEAIIRSMTPDERREPVAHQRLAADRASPRAAASRTADVNDLLKQFKQVQQMMKGMGKGKGCRSSRRAWTSASSKASSSSQSASSRAACCRGRSPRCAISMRSSCASHVSSR